MKPSQYKEKLELAWSQDTFILKGRRGTSIYKEERENHIKGMRRVESGKEFPMLNHDYLVFELQEEVDVREIDFRFEHGVVIKKTSYGTEISCHHPQVFHNGMLHTLKRLGYIKVTWKESMKDKREYPLYVDPNGWQLLFNVGSLLIQGMHKGCYYFYRKFAMRVFKGGN